MTPLLCIYGEETFLAEQALEEVLKEKPLSHSFGSDVSLPKLRLALSSSGLFHSDICILIKNPWFFQKTPEDDWIPLFQLFQKMKHTLILYQEGIIDFRKKIPAFLKKEALLKECSPFKDWESEKILQWIIDWAKKQELAIDRDVAELLLLINGKNLRLLASEIRTLRVFTQGKKKVSIADITALNQGYSGSIYDFTEAFKKREISNLLQCLTRLNEDPVRLIAILFNSAFFYLQLLVLNQQKVPVSKMASLLGKNPYFITKVLTDIKKVYTPLGLSLFIQALSDLDSMVKSGKAIPSTALTQTLLTLR